MANQEWENRMNELRDSQLVTQRLLERLEGSVGRLGDNVEHMEARVDRIGEAVEIIATNTIRLQEQARAHENDIVELRSAMISLIANIDRFIQGRQPNGH